MDLTSNTHPAKLAKSVNSIAEHEQVSSWVSDASGNSNCVMSSSRLSLVLSNVRMDMTCDYVNMIKYEQIWIG